MEANHHHNAASRPAKAADVLVHNAPGNVAIIKTLRTPDVDISTVNIILLVFGRAAPWRHSEEEKRPLFAPMRPL